MNLSKYCIYLVALFCYCSAISQKVSNLPVAFNKISNIEFPNPIFIGREDLLESIKHTFKKHDLVMLTGFGGIGKTQLARKYTKLHYSNYRILWWFDMEKDLTEQFLSLSKLLAKRYKFTSLYDHKIEPVNYAKEVLTLLDESWLLVFDNVPKLDVIRSYLPYIRSSSEKHILITSRNNNNYQTAIKVGKLAEADSKILINTMIPKMDLKHLKQLAELFSGYPLSIIQGAAFINNYPLMTVEKYIAMYNKERNHLLAKEKEFFSTEQNSLIDYKLDVSTVVNLSKNVLKLNYLESLKLLEMITFLGTKNIPQIFLKKYVSKYYNKDFEIVIYPLLKYHFLSETTAHNDSNYLIHDLVKNHIKASIKPREARSMIAQSAKIMYDILNQPRSKIIDFVNQHPEIIYHANELIDNANSINYYSLDLVCLKMLLLEYYFSGLRDYAKGYDLMTEIEQDLKEVKNVDLQSKLRFMTNKVNYYMWKADYKNAITVGSQTIKLMKKNNLLYEEYYRLLVYLAYVYNMQGDNLNAMKILEECTKNDKLTKLPYIYSIYLYVKAGVLTDQGNFEEALIAENACLDISKENNFSYPSYHHRELLKVQLLNLTNKPEEALDLSRKLLSKFKTIDVKENHINMGKLLLGFADAQTRLKKIELAKKDITNAINIFDRWYKNTNHRDQALASLTLARLHLATRNYKEALKEYIKAEGMYHKVLTDFHIIEMAELYSDLVLLGIEINDRYLAKKYFGLLVDKFGYSHSYTIKLLDYLEINKIKL